MTKNDKTSKKTIKRKLSAKEGRAKSKPSDIDIEVGKRLRMRRSFLGMSQEGLADAVGLTFQQIQKYERGTNRISAGRLHEFCRILKTDFDYFFSKIPNDNDLVQSNSPALAVSDNKQRGIGDSPDLLSRKETIKLLREYYAVEDEEKRKDIYNVVKTMADSLK